MVGLSVRRWLGGFVGWCCFGVVCRCLLLYCSACDVALHKRAIATACTHAVAPNLLLSHSVVLVLRCLALFFCLYLSRLPHSRLLFLSPPPYDLLRWPTSSCARSVAASLLCRLSCRLSVAVAAPPARSFSAALPLSLLLRVHSVARFFASAFYAASRCALFLLRDFSGRSLRRLHLRLLSGQFVCFAWLGP